MTYQLPVAESTCRSNAWQTVTIASNLPIFILLRIVLKLN